jgi:hypothetical protein
MQLKSLRSQFKQQLLEEPLRLSSPLEQFDVRDSNSFTVKESKVFEIAELTTLPADIKKCANGHLFQERARDAGAGAAGRLRETQTSDSASGKARNARGGCS